MVAVLYRTVTVWYSVRRSGSAHDTIKNIAMMVMFIHACFISILLCVDYYTGHGGYSLGLIAMVDRPISYLFFNLYRTFFGYNIYWFTDIIALSLYFIFFIFGSIQFYFFIRLIGGIFCSLKRTRE